MGNYRNAPDTKKTTVSGDCDRFSFAASGMCGWRLTMEDAHISIPKFTQKNFGLFAVFDGHGGQQAAKFAEKNFPIVLQKNQHFLKGDYEKGLIDAFLQVDALMITQQGKQQLKKYQTKQQQNEADQDSFPGCTANVCLITDSHLFVANAGDSRCIVVHKGKVQDMSVDHKPENQLELKRIHSAGGQVIQGRVNGNLNLSRALGDFQYKLNKQLSQQNQMITAKPDVKKKSLDKIELLVIGCDGVWEIKTNEEVGQMIYDQAIKKKQNLVKVVQETLDKLVAPDCNDENGLDNMTLVVVKIKK